MINRRPERKADKRLLHMTEHLESIKTQIDLIENMVREMREDNERLIRKEDEGN